MRILMTCLVLVLLVVNTSAAEEKKTVELATDIQKLSYTLGLDLGAYFKTLGEDIDLNIVVSAYKSQAGNVGINYTAV